MVLRCVPVNFPAQDPADSILQASQGDKQALESLLGRYLPELRSFVRLQMGPLVSQKESSSDIVQSCCRQVLDKLEGLEYRGELAFKKWLFVACTNKLRDRERHWMRQQRDVRRENYLDDVADPMDLTLSSPSGEFLRREEIEKLQQALDSMPEDYRRVVTMSRLLGMSHADEDFGKSEGATRALLHRAIARLGLLLSRNDT